MSEPTLDEIKSAVEDYAISYLEQIKEEASQEKETWRFGNIAKISTKNRIEWRFSVNTYGGKSSYTGVDSFIVSFRVSDRKDSDVENVNYIITTEAVWIDEEVISKNTVFSYTGEGIDELKYSVEKELPKLRLNNII